MPTIDINGAQVPRNKAVVFLHWGHSNMAGRATVPTSERAYFYTPQPRIWSFAGGKFVAAQEPTAPDASVNQGAGPGMALLRVAAEQAQPDVHFISVSRAKGSVTTIDFGKGGLHYRALLDAAKPLVGKVTFGAMFVMMGVTERHMTVPEQAGFPDRMSQIVAGIRADLGEPNLPVLHCDYEVESTGDLSLASDFAKRIRPLILGLPNRIMNLVIVPTDKIAMQDDHHFNMLGHRAWAERAIKLLREKGWAPWAR
jgi:hypothetical protein